MSPSPPKPLPFRFIPKSLAPGAERPPAVTWIYGGLGLIPFFGGAIAAVGLSGLGRIVAQLELIAYGALILSFLGGGRWGLEIGRRPVRAVEISASMLPTVVAFLILITMGAPNSWRLVAMSLAFVAQWAWDVRSKDTPPWYPPLRHLLTAGAVGCMLVGAAASV